jgi:hypothetical protein
VKLTELPKASELVDRRYKLQALVDAVEVGLIDVILGGKYADESLKAVCRAPLIAECQAQIAFVDRQLAGLGVEVD